MILIHLSRACWIITGALASIIRRKKFVSKNKNKSLNQVKACKTHGEGDHESSLTSNSDQNGKCNRKRKDEENDTEDNRYEDEDPSTQKKPRVVWGPELHQEFLRAVYELGIEKAVPKRILDLMNVEGLTRENVASHLQKYRLYLKRTIPIATQQANMVAVRGSKSSRFMRMGLLDRVGDLQTLAGPSRLADAALSRYSTSGMLGRPNSLAGVNLCDTTPSALTQPHCSQNLSNSINVSGKMNTVLSPTSQTSRLVQGIPSLLELDQLQQNNHCTGTVNFNSMDDLRMVTAASTFSVPGAEIGSSSYSTHSTKNDPTVLHRNSQQELNDRGFGNQSSLNMASESLNMIVSGSSNFLDHGNQVSKLQPNSLLFSEPFHGQFHLNSVRNDNPSNGPFSQNILTSAPLQDSNGEMHFQDNLVGNLQNINQAGSQSWGEQEQNLIYSSNNAFGALNSHFSAADVFSSLGKSLDHSTGIFNENTDMFISGQPSGSASTLMQNDIQRLATQPKTGFNADDYLRQSKLQGGIVPQTCDSLDYLMNAIIKPVCAGDFNEDLI